jgi:hypothetical protein
MIFCYAFHVFQYDHAWNVPNQPLTSTHGVHIAWDSLCIPSAEKVPERIMISHHTLFWDDNTKNEVRYKRINEFAR